MRVLFFFPNYYKESGMPQGIPFLSAVLKAHGHETRCVDTTFINCPDTVHAKTGTLQKQFKKTNYDEVVERPEDNVSIEEHFTALLEQFKPDLLAVSITTDMFPLAEKVLRNVNRDHQLPVVYGGVHPTIDPEAVIRSDTADFVCIGEGEYTLLELCDRLGRKEDPASIQGLWVKRDGVIHRNPVRQPPDLNELPMPDWSVFDDRQFIKPFRGNLVRLAYYIQSRGCPYKCTYCTNNYMNRLYAGYKYHRRPSNAKTIADLKHLKQQYRLDMLRFFDDVFLLDTTENLEDFKKQYIEHVNLPFIISVRPNLVDAEKVRILKEMGCRVATLGIESGSPRIRKDVFRRAVSNEQILSAFKLMKEAGIQTTSLNMMGTLTETREEIFETIRLNREAQVDNFVVTFIYPYPNTEYREMLVEAGLDRGEFDKCGMNDAYKVQMSKLPESELRGIYRTLPLYSKLPVELYPVIELAEKDDPIGQKIYNALQELLQKHYSAS